MMRGGDNSIISIILLLSQTYPIVYTGQMNSLLMSNCDKYLASNNLN